MRPNTSAAVFCWLSTPKTISGISRKYQNTPTFAGGLGNIMPTMSQHIMA